MKALPYTAIIMFVAFAASAADNKYVLPYAPGAGHSCPGGEAMTYTMQCDPGSRLPVDEIWGTRMPGAAVCRVRLEGCRAVEGFDQAAEFGYLVRDARPMNEMVVVTFGVERLLGEWR